MFRTVLTAGAREVNTSSFYFIGRFLASIFVTFFAFASNASTQSFGAFDFEQKSNSCSATMLFETQLLEGTKQAALQDAIDKVIKTDLVSKCPVAKQIALKIRLSSGASGTLILKDTSTWKIDRSRFLQILGSDSKPKSAGEAQVAKDKSRAAAGGYLYKDKTYWAQIGNNYALKVVFDGKIPLSASSSAVEQVSLQYIRKKYKNCPSYYKSSAVIFETIETTTVVNGYNTTLSSSSRKVGETLVSKELAPVYAKYTNAQLSLDQASTQLKSEFDGWWATLEGKPGGHIEAWVNQYNFNKDVGLAIERMFEVEGCDSPVFRQLEYNIQAYALQTPTVQGVVR